MRKLAALNRFTWVDWLIVIGFAWAAFVLCGGCRAPLATATLFSPPAEEKLVEAVREGLTGLKDPETIEAMAKAIGKAIHDALPPAVTPEPRSDREGLIAAVVGTAAILIDRRWFHHRKAPNGQTAP